jgi:hypothetical protein
MESILNDIVAMVIEEGPVLFQMTTRVVLQEFGKGKTRNGNLCKGKK